MFNISVICLKGHLRKTLTQDFNIFPDIQPLRILSNALLTVILWLMVLRDFHKKEKHQQQKDTPGLKLTKDSVEMDLILWNVE